MGGRGRGKERKRKKGGEVLAEERRGDAANQIYTRERERESNNEISRKVSPRLPVLIALRESALGQRFVYRERQSESCKISEDGWKNARILLSKRNSSLHFHKLGTGIFERRLIDVASPTALLLTPQRHSDVVVDYDDDYDS